MIKTNESGSTNKYPWVPPPARTSKNTKTLASAKNLASSSLGKSAFQDEEAKVSNTMIMEKSSFSELDAFNSKSHLEKSATSSQTSSTIDFTKNSNDVYDQYQEFHRDMKMMRIHCNSLKLCSQSLHKPIKVSPVDDQAARSIISQSDVHIESLFETFDELEAHLGAFEISAKEGTEELAEYLIACQQSKDLLVLKMLKSYDSTTTALKFVFEVQMQGDMSALQRENDILKKKLETLIKHQTELEKELALSEQCIQALQLQKLRTEENNVTLKRELDRKDMVIQRQKLYAESQTQLMKNVAENERLLEILEELQNTHAAEKEALKKALKVQKVRADQCDENAENAKIKLSEKESLVYSLANERDEWKMQLTAINNKLIESESRIEDLQRKNIALQDKFINFETYHEDEVSKMKVIVEEKSDLLEKCRKESEIVKDSAALLEKKLDQAEQELRGLKEKYEELNSTFRLETENTYRKLEEESKVLITLLQDVKSNFASQGDTTNLHENNIHNDQHDGATLLGLVKDVKEQLADAKKMCQQYLQVNLKTALTESMEKQKEHFQERIEREIGEKFELQKKCEYLEKIVQNPRQPVSGLFTSNIQNSFQPYVRDEYKSYPVESEINIEKFPDNFCVGYQT